MTSVSREYTQTSTPKAKRKPKKAQRVRRAKPKVEGRDIIRERSQTPAIEGGSKERKQRLKLKALQALEMGAQESHLLGRKRHRLAECGTPFLDRVVAGVRGGKRSLKGLYRCGQTFCPFCGPKKSAENLRRISDTIHRHKALNPEAGTMCFTLTVSRDMQLCYSHDDVALWQENQLLIDEAWSHFSRKYTVDLRIELGWWSHIKKTEVVYSPGRYLGGQIKGAGAHFHIHGIALLKNLATQGKGELEVSTFIHTRWNKSVRAAVRKLRASGRKLGWIDLRRKNVVTPPTLESEGDNILVRGGVNVYFPKNTIGASSYLEKLSSQHAMSLSESSNGSYPGHMLPALMGTKLQFFALKAFNFHVLTSEGRHSLEFGRIREGRRNPGVDKFLAERVPAGSREGERGTFIPTHVAHGSEFRRGALITRDRQIELHKALDDLNDQRLEQDFPFFKRVETPEEARQLAYDTDCAILKRIAKGLVEGRGIATGDFALNWYFDGDEGRRQAYIETVLPHRPRQTQIRTDFNVEWAKIRPGRRRIDEGAI